MGKINQYALIGIACLLIQCGADPHVMEKKGYTVLYDMYLIESPYFKKYRGKKIFELVPASFGATKSRIPTSLKDWRDNKDKYQMVSAYIKKGETVHGIAEGEYNDWKSGSTIRCTIFKSDYGLVFIDTAKMPATLELISLDKKSI